MKSYHESFLEENEYLEKTIALIEAEIEKESENLSGRKRELIAARKDMWENAAHHSSDFNKMTEVSQHLNEVSNHTANYSNTLKRVKRLEKLHESPYFGRFDFIEDGNTTEEKVYIGLYSLMDPRTQNIIIYDWRAPVSGIFYRFEPGKAYYAAPCGDITGEVLLKRQYKIRNSKLEYFFDCSMRINDEVLQEALSRNTSVKMRNIVETIQKEQDTIIRDSENELLIVQGVAGSGKTSIALHRVAFLLYEGIESMLDSNNIMIISPNVIFSRYISSVLPELGEENVEQITVDELVKKCLGGAPTVESRNSQMEALLGCRDDGEIDILRQSADFKGSGVFVTILDRLLREFEHRLLEFEDVYYNGTIIEGRQQLKNSFLNNKIDMPAAKRLKRLESIILSRISPLQEKRLKDIERIVEKDITHAFEIKPFSRLLSLRETKRFLERLHKFTEVDCFSLYKKLFSDTELFRRVSRDLKLPAGIDRITAHTRESLGGERLRYEDAVPILYLKLKIEGENLFPQIKQVVIDEAQDYYPLHYEVFKTLFGSARYTVMGDVAQAVGKKVELSLYDEIARIFNRRKTVKILLNKSYRASFEISTFARRFLDEKLEYVPFERHEKEPVIVHESTRSLLEQRVADDIKSYFGQGFGTAAVICKTQKQARQLYKVLKGYEGIKLLDMESEELEAGVLITPVYMSKGLEFDAVLVYDVDDSNYSSSYDKKLLFIACTRALHRLSLYYTGEKSRLL